MIEHLATHTMIQTRMQLVTGSRQAFATVTAVSGALQPASPQQAALYGGVYGRTFRFFCEGNLDIQEGDRLRYFPPGIDWLIGHEEEVSIFYRVKAGGVNRRQYGAIDYLEVVCERL